MNEHFTAMQLSWCNAAFKQTLNITKHCYHNYSMYNYKMLYWLSWIQGMKLNIYGDALNFLLASPLS